MIRTFLNSSYYIASIPVLTLVLLNTVVQKRMGRRQNRIFLIISINLMITAILGVIRFAILPYRLDSTLFSVITVSYHYIYFALHSTLPFLFFSYIICINGSIEKGGGLLRNALFLPLILSELLILSNLISDRVWYYDSELNFHRGPLEVLLYAEAAFYLLMAFISLYKNARAITRKRLRALTLYLIVIVLGVLIQLIIKELRCEMFFESLALFGIMLVIENEDERLDMVTGVYNRNAFIQDLRIKMAQNTPFGVISIRLNNVDRLSRMLGAQINDDLIVYASDHLKEIYPWYSIYRTTPIDFTVLTGVKELDELAQRIYEDFASGKVKVHEEAALKAAMIKAAVPDELSSINDIFLMADGTVGEGEDELIGGSELWRLTRSVEIENALARAAAGDGFKVVYQSLHTKEDHKLCAIKALVRLEDEKLGEVMPDEFIPIAEKNGTIHTIGMFVLEEVCRFIKEVPLKEAGVRKMHLNLAYVQCLDPAFVPSVIAMTEKYGVDPNFITLEITKPITRNEFPILDSVIKQLKEKGFTFAVEDFGSGYANTEIIFALDIDMVKLDRLLLWNAQNGDDGEIILASSVRMIRNLKKYVLVEGVESSELLSIADDIGPDILQGYYFSRPADREELVRRFWAGK